MLRIYVEKGRGLYICYVYIYPLNDRKIPTVTLATYRNIRTLPGTILLEERERADG